MFRRAQLGCILQQVCNCMFCNKFQLSADLTVTENYNGFGDLPYVIVINDLLNSTCILSCLILAHDYTHAFSKTVMRIFQSPPSVRHAWTKSNQIWCVCCSHEWDVQRHIFFLAPPPGALGGAKRSNII